MLLVYRVLHVLVGLLSVVLSIVEIGILRSSTNIIEWPIFSYMCVSFCFVYFGTLLLFAYMFKFVICSSLIDLFIIIKYPSLSLVTIFVLKSTLSDVSKY